MSPWPARAPETSPLNILTLKGAALGAQAGAGTAHHVHKVAGVRDPILETYNAILKVQLCQCILYLVLIGKSDL